MLRGSAALLRYCGFAFTETECIRRMKVERKAYYR
jgi:hypothetical protein